jgi:hypothetical protein
MKIALCLFGTTGTSGGFGTGILPGEGAAIHPRICYEYYKKNLFNHNDVDVYMHSWSGEWKTVLLDLYNPVRHSFEKQIKFNKDPFTHRAASRWFSTLQSVHLVGEGYDMIMLSRFDVAFLKPIDFSGYDPSCFYVGHYNVPGSKIDYTGRPLPKEIRTKWFYAGINISKKRHGFIDLWFFGGVDIIRKFSMLYYYKNAYDISPHIAARQHIQTITNNVKHTMYIGEDFDLIRRLSINLYSTPARTKALEMEEKFKSNV